MSVRIHELAKKLGMENKDLLSLLKDRGHAVKSPSSTIDNISAEALEEEFKNRISPVVESQPEAEVPAEGALPQGRSIVKSADEVEAEHKAEADAEKAEAAATPAPSTPESAKPALKSPLPPPPIKAPPSLGKMPPPTPPVFARNPAPVPPPVSRPAPVTPILRAPTPPPSQQPPQRSAPPPAPPVNRPAPVREVPIVRSAPTPPPFVRSAPASLPPPSIPAKPSESAPAPSGTPTILTVKPPIIVRDFAVAMGLRPFRLISELMEMGIFASMNQTIEEETSRKLAEKHGFILEVRHRGEPTADVGSKKTPEKPKLDETKLMEPRPPVVVIMGHVDHGKTTLLDHIRNTRVVEGEAGGITQHIGAYQVTVKDHKITFLDTPGHAAFTKMRERGTSVTDIAILVVAADDGFMPQTDEALKIAQKANVPVIVAINKMDAKGANIDRVKQQMQQRNIAPEDWGGETLCTPISALKGQNIEALLELVILQAEMLELKANPKADPEGIVVESQIETGLGPTATIIVRRGTLRKGDALVCNNRYCRVRMMLDDLGKNLKEVRPGTPARVTGWDDAPEAGATFHGVKNEREAKALAQENDFTSRKEDQQQNATPRVMDLANLMAAIENNKQKVLRVLIKGDVHGSVEALQGCLMDIKSDKVTLEVIDSGVGLISENDVQMASAAQASIVAFNVKQENGVLSLAKHHGVHIVSHNIIYELITLVRDAMSELLDPELRENKLGGAEVRQVFELSKAIVAGCMVTEGRITRDGHARVLRKGASVFEGRIDTLKRFKDDVSEVRAGFECGIRVGGFDHYETGDQIECFEILKIRPQL